MVLPGPFADDPEIFSKLMALFNPLYHFNNPRFGKSSALQKAEAMLAYTANEFFGPQMWVQFFCVIV